MWSTGLQAIGWVTCAAVLWWDVLPYMRRNAAPAAVIAVWLGIAGLLGVGALGCTWGSRFQAGRRVRPALRLAATSASLVALPFAGWAMMRLVGGAPPGGAAVAARAAGGIDWFAAAVAGLAGVFAITAWSLVACDSERLRLPPAPWPDEETTRRRRGVALLAGLLACGAAVLVLPDRCAHLLAPLEPAPAVGGRSARAWLDVLRQPARRAAGVDALSRSGPAAGPVLVALATDVPAAELARRSWGLRCVDELAGAFGALPAVAEVGRRWHPDLDGPSEWREAAVHGLARVARQDAAGVPFLVQVLAPPDDGHPPLLGEALSFYGPPAVNRLIARNAGGRREAASAVLAALDAEHPHLRRHPVEGTAGARTAPALTDDEVFHRTPWLAQIGPLGPAEARVDLVVLGDGYAVSDLVSNGKFWRDARRATASLFAVEPFRRHRAQFNIHVVVPDWPRGEAGYATRGAAICAPFDCQGGWCGVERLVVPREQFRAWAEPRRVRGVDVALLLVNIRGYGGAATRIGSVGYAICPTDTLDTRVVAHEVGHALGGLGDEYADDRQLAAINPLPKVDDLRPPNVAMARMVTDATPTGLRRSLKWAGLAEQRWGVNWPSYAYVPGGYYRTEGVIRPTDACIMNNHVAATAFCYVCEAALESAIMAATSEGRGPSPSGVGGRGTARSACAPRSTACGSG